jgi:hypothetical protein
MFIESADIVFWGHYDVEDETRRDMRRSWNGSSS